jgi:hypothetical protein
MADAREDRVPSAGGPMDVPKEVHEAFRNKFAELYKLPVSVGERAALAAAFSLWLANLEPSKEAERAAAINTYGTSIDWTGNLDGVGTFAPLLRAAYRAEAARLRAQQEEPK